MGGDREKAAPREHHWDFFNLSDFQSKSCWAGFTYGIVWIMLGISIACYVLDILTCYQLIIFDKWEGQVQITTIIPFEISRWIFTGCIILSFIFLAYRWWKAIRAIKSGSVVQSYLDPLAVRVQSIRVGKAQGWRRFLVFAALTKSKKGAEYVALFSYFSFEAALRILLAEGPRQVINGLTIYSIMRSDIIPVDGTERGAPPGSSPITQFFLNVKILAEGDTLRAIVLFGMIFTVIVWVIAFLSLATACILYLVFLWHHIPSRDGGLRGYCKRKVDSKLQAIVDKKIRKAFEREEKLRAKQEAKAAKAGLPVPGIKKQPTLPVLTGDNDKLPDMPSLSRQPTFGTLPPYESRPGTPGQGQGQLPAGANFSRPGMPTRSETQSTTSSNAPLMGAATGMGYSQPRPYSPAQMSTNGSFSNGPPPLGRSLTGTTQSSQGSFSSQPPLNRSMTGSTQASQGQYNNGQRPQNQGRPMGPPMRQNTGNSQFGPDRQFTPSPSMRSNTPNGDPRGDPRYPPGPPRRQNTGMSDGYYGGQPDRSDSASIMTANSSYNRRTPGPGNSVSQQDIEMQYRQQQPPPPTNQPFRPYSPALSSPGQGPRIPFTGAPPRNFTEPVHALSNSFDRPYTPPSRSGTAPPQTSYTAFQPNQYNGRPNMPTRSATTAPSYEEWPQHGL